MIETGRDAVACPSRFYPGAADVLVRQPENVLIVLKFYIFDFLSKFGPPNSFDTDV